MIDLETKLCLAIDKYRAEHPATTTSDVCGALYRVAAVLAGEHERLKCHWCDGKGKVPCSPDSFDVSNGADWVRCTPCHGTGRRGAQPGSGS